MSVRALVVMVNGDALQSFGTGGGRVIADAGTCTGGGHGGGDTLQSFGMGGRRVVEAEGRGRLIR